MQTFPVEIKEDIRPHGDCRVKRKTRSPAVPAAPSRAPSQSRRNRSVRDVPEEQAAGGGGGAGEETKDGKQATGSGSGGGGGGTASPVGFIEVRDGEARFVRITNPGALVPLIVAATFSTILLLRALRGFVR